MSYKKFLGAASAALMIVIALILALAPAAGAAGKYKALHAFHGSDGSDPYGGLILDVAGNLYGTTNAGGAHGLGTAFKLALNADGSWTESVLHSFNGRDGVGPVGDLTFDAAGNLYGTTANGGSDQFGTVFKLTPNADGSWTESVLHRFQGNPADTPRAGLIFDGAGNLYGTASSARSENDGAVFKLSPNQAGGWTYSLIHIFQGKPALSPGFSGLVLGSAGTLYGTTEGCSTSCEGVVYQITP